MLRILRGNSQDHISKKLISDLLAAADAAPDKKFVIIVPEQATLNTQMSVATAHPRKACMNIDVVSFDRLAHVVLAKLGKDGSEILDDVGKALILRKVLSGVRDDLKVYGNKIHMAGFVEEIKSMVTEFKQYRVDDRLLGQMENEASGKSTLLQSKLQDLRLIYRKFNETIEDKYRTTEEVLEVFANVMGESDFLKGASVYLDGFTGFTPIQRRIIGKMLTECDEVVVALVLPESKKKEYPKDFELFKLSNDTFLRLRDEAVSERCEFRDEWSESSGFEPGERRLICKGYAGMQEEVREVAGAILKLTREDGLRFRDIAVIASDMEGYHDLIQRTFNEAGIRCFVDYKEPLSDNLLIRFIMSALYMSAKGVTVANIFAVLKNSLSGIPADEVSRLENYCLEFNIKGPSRWDSPFTLNRKVYGSDEDFWNLDELNETREFVNNNFIKFYRGTSSGSRDVKIYCTLLRRFLEINRVGEKIEKMAGDFKEAGNLAGFKQYSLIYDDVKDLIDKIEKLMEGEKVLPLAFAEIFESGIKEIKVAIIPPSVDCLIVGDLTRTRLVGVSHLFVLGVNEGKLPSKGSSSAILTQREREFLLEKKFEIAPTAFENLCTERFYAYLAFNKPAKELCLTWVASENGEKLERSSLFHDMDELVPDLAKQLADAGTEGPETVLWLSEALRRAASYTAGFVNGKSEPDAGLLRAVRDAKPHALRAVFDGAFYSNIQTPLDSQVALDLYGGLLKGSVSRFESFYGCPYRHFLNYGMGLEKRREFKIEVTDLGTIYHETLEKYSRRLKEEGFTFRDISDEDSHRITKESVEEAIEELSLDVLKSSARNVNYMGRICQIAERTTDVLREHVKAGRFEPEEYEYPFSFRQSENVEFKGKIDRIDIYDSEDVFIKIIDYKSGSKSFSVEDIYSGLQLQLVAYVNSAVKKIGEKFPGKNVRPGGIYYYRINDKYTKEEDGKSKFQMSGLTLSRPGIPRAMDQNVDEDAARFGSGIIPNTKADEDEFAHLIEYVDLKIEEAGKRIIEGEISINPYQKGNEPKGCKYCDYKDICRFDDGSSGSVARCEDSLEKAEKEAIVYGRN